MAEMEPVSDQTIRFTPTEDGFTPPPTQLVPTGRVPYGGVDGAMVVKDAPLPPRLSVDGVPIDDSLDDDVAKALDEEMRREELLDRALAKYDTSSLATKPGKKDNWIEAVGGDLPAFVRAVAHALMREGRPRSQAIGMAIGTIKRWAAGGGDVSAKTRAKAAKTVAEWEALKAKAAAK